MKGKFNRERIRFHIKKPNILVIQGWYEDDADGAEQFQAQMGSQILPLEVLVQKGVEVTKKYLRYKTNVMTEYFLMIELPSNYEQAGELEVFHREEDGSLKKIFRASGSSLSKKKTHLESWMETLRETPDGKYQLSGWYIGVDHAETAILDTRGKIVKSECKTGHRLDILGEFPEAALEDTKAFELTFAPGSENHYRLALKGGGKKALYFVNCKKMLSGKEGLANLMKKSYLYFKRNGFKQFVKRVSDQVLEIDSISYERWRRKYGLKKSEIEEQRKHQFKWNPKFSILVPIYRTPEKFLREMIDSVLAQTYTNWELVLSDGSFDEGKTAQLLRQYAQKDDRIVVVENEEQLRIAQNTNAAMKTAAGEYIVFGDHDDLFSPDALFECVKILNEKPETALIYSDEDKVDASGKRYFEPHFKSDYNPDLLCSMNYFCHMVMVSRELAETVGYLNPDFDGAQDYDYVLRCTEAAGQERIVHIPKILYHWRSHGDSTAENPESKKYAFDAGRRAIQAHYDRLGLRATVIDGEYPGLYHTEFEIIGDPLVSILIPNKDHITDLRKCLRSIEKSDYKNYEIIVIENNSTEEETFSGYEELKQEYPMLKVVQYSGSFNFSDINNFGARSAAGDYYLLLNNDTEFIGTNGIRQMLSYCQRKDVGIVGARLYYEDDTIQHAGVVLGFGGIAGHTFIGEKRTANGYFSRIICAQDYSAVTAACMMVKASVFHEVNGMSIDLPVAFNDIDFCMKVRQTGKWIVYNPAAELYHYESKSRGLENTQEKVERFNQEMARFLDRWGAEVRVGDPFYNPNLTLDKANFSLKY